MKNITKDNELVKAWEMIADEALGNKETDEYIYIPVWKLSTNGSPADMDLMMEMEDTNIRINAIDGSRIEPEKIGIVSVDLQGMGDYE